MKSHHDKFQTFKSVLQVIAAVIFLTIVMVICAQFGGGAIGLSS